MLAIGDLTCHHEFEFRTFSGIPLLTLSTLETVHLTYKGYFGCPEITTASGARLVYFSPKKNGTPGSAGISING
jgi:hypothetical protein